MSEYAVDIFFVVHLVDGATPLISFLRLAADYHYIKENEVHPLDVAVRTKTANLQNSLHLVSHASVLLVIGEGPWNVLGYLL